MQAKTAFVAILVSVVGIGSGTTSRAHMSEDVVTTHSGDWVGRPDLEPPYRDLSLDLLTLAAPSPRRDGRPHPRWWAAIVVGAIVDAGWLASESAAPATEVTESLLRRLELSVEVPFVKDHLDERFRLRFRLTAKRAQPKVGWVLSW